MRKFFADIETTKLRLMWVIAASLILLNVQFFVTFRLKSTVHTSGDAWISGGEVTALPPQEVEGAAPRAPDASKVNELRSVLSNRSIEPGLFGTTIANAASLKLSC